MKDLKRIIDNGNLTKAALIVKALANKEKLRILKFISENPDCISKNIYNTLTIEQAVVSQHLKKLFAEEIVFATREERRKKLNLNHVKLHRLIDRLETARSEHKLMKDLDTDYSRKSKK